MDATCVAIWVRFAAHSKISHSELLRHFCALLKQLCRNFLDVRVARSLFCLYGCKRTDVGAAQSSQPSTNNLAAGQTNGVLGAI